ncbi:MAG: hypothetical protein JO253_09455 [Alphaproteobacteria bacterium]|nr:hypothetical protein [Alphaproteobacteria bacterium]
MTGQQFALAAVAAVGLALLVGPLFGVLAGIGGHAAASTIIAAKLSGSAVGAVGGFLGACFMQQHKPA